MAFHYSILGVFGESFKQFADLKGYVPEGGDRPESFSWLHDSFLRDYSEKGLGFDGFAEIAWQRHLGDSIRATSYAVKALLLWRGV